MAAAITQQGQWYRLFTPMVLHGSFTHLAVNSMSFSSVGPVVRMQIRRLIVFKGNAHFTNVASMYCTSNAAHFCLLHRCMFFQICFVSIAVGPE